MSISDLPTMKVAAKAIASFGVKNVLVKGGAFDGDAVDLLWTAGAAHVLHAPGVDTRHTHGTGCVPSTAITV